MGSWAPERLLWGRDFNSRGTVSEGRLSSASAEEQLRDFAVQNYEEAVSAALKNCLWLRVSGCSHGMARTGTAAPICLFQTLYIFARTGGWVPLLSCIRARPMAGLQMRSVRGSCWPPPQQGGLRLARLRMRMRKTQSGDAAFSQTAGLCLDALAQFGAVSAPLGGAETERKTRVWTLKRGLQVSPRPSLKERPGRPAVDAP
ncbi:unnamed protein product [Symbiodinium sp. CCMP2592]|nr:unnamed protein product [Symbiodinium sp. CCMP2592]